MYTWIRDRVGLEEKGKKDTDDDHEPETKCKLRDCVTVVTQWQW